MNLFLSQNEWNSRFNMISAKYNYQQRKEKGTVREDKIIIKATPSWWCELLFYVEIKWAFWDLFTKIKCNLKKYIRLSHISIKSSCISCTYTLWSIYKHACNLILFHFCFMWLLFTLIQSYFVSHIIILRKGFKTILIFSRIVGRLNYSAYNQLNLK